MKKLFTLLTMLVLGIGSMWADVPDDIFSTDYENAVWLSITNANNNSYVMFPLSNTMGTRAKGSTNYAANQQIAFVGTKSSFKIYSYSQGSNKALKAASDNPGRGTTVSWVEPSSASTWVLHDDGTTQYGVCLSGKTSYSLNMYAGAGNDCKFYDVTNNASRWTISKTSNLVVEDGKVYKISSHQFSGSNYQIINSTTASQVINTGDEIATNQGYWLCHKDNAVYTFESAMADGKYIGWKELSTTAEEYYLHFATATNNTTCISLYRKNGSTSSSKYLYVHKNASGGTNGWNQNSSGAFADGGSTDYKFEEVTGVSVYTVVSNIKNGGVTYTPSYTGTATQTKDGFYVFASTPSASDFTAISVTNYTPGAVTIDTSAKTITVNYTATITYTLTDENGATYSWSASGTYGTAPTISGCYGSTLSNEVWNEESRTYTADITFPFPISSNSVTNWCYINIFDAKTNYKISDGYWFYWHADGYKVIAHDKDEPTNETGKIDEYKWAMIPAINNGAITFTIKNAVANKFIYHDDTETYSYHTGIKLGDTGVAVTYVKDASADKYYLYIPSVKKYISANSVTGGTNQRVGAYGSVHDGESVAFYEPTNFSTLMANLKTARTSFNNYFLPWTQGKYTETVEGTMTTTYSQIGNDRNVVNYNPTEYFTASQFKSYTDNYNNAVKGLRYVVPSFFRVKNLDGTKYATAYWKDYTNYIQLRFNSSGDDAGSIFYLNDDNNIISFASGSYLFAINHTAPVEYFQYKCTYEFLPGSSVDRIYVHTVKNPSGWGGNEKYWIADDTKIGRGTEPTANSDFLIEPVTSLPVTFNSAALGYATFNSPVPLQVPSNTTAYICKVGEKEVDDKTVNTLTFYQITNITTKDNAGNDVPTIPANTPVLLYNSTVASSNVTVDFPITSLEYDMDATYIEGSFGTLAAESFDDVNDVWTDSEDNEWDIYSLRVNSTQSKVGFYKKTTGTTLAGFKAWLKTQHTDDARNFVISFDGEGDPTGIVEALGLQNDNVEIYDLNGRKLSSYKKGINIVNGKKVMIQ